MAMKNDGNMINNGQKRGGKDSGAPSRSLASSLQGAGANNNIWREQ